MELEKKKKFPWWSVIIIVIFVGAAGAAGYYGYKHYKNKKDEQKKSAEEKTVDEYAGWNTYTNKDVGYTLRYPGDWSLTEVNQKSDLTEQDIKYVGFATPLGSGLHFGLSREEQTWFNISDRTGIGAGEDMPILEKSGTLLSATIVPEAHVWENQTNEYFYKINGNPGFNTAIWLGTKEMLAWPDPARTWPELDTVNKIFASVVWTSSYTQYDPASAENLAKAKAVAEKYLDARKTRDIANAYNYMTNEFQKKMTQEEFAGVSSPSFGSYSDVTAEYIPADKEYKVTATIHWMLQGEESNTSTWTLNVVNNAGNFQVDDVTGNYE